jgi:NADH-quinone oxidoreductase subunit M
MLVAIIFIYWLTGTTDITQIYEIKIPKEYQNILWLAFFSSFAVKMPMWPVHTWLPDAHVEAPTAGSVILAAILLKMAGYGFLRFSIGMFPIASEYFTPLIFTLSVIAIISIYWITGTTDIAQIFEIKISTKYQYVLWLAFFSSFAVKMPMWPVHTWLPDAHVEAPTAGSVILAAILLKMAGYGFLRFSLGIFPVASDYFTPLIFSLSIIAIIYTSLIALMQDDMKKLIAYSSVAHMGFVTIGIFSVTKQGLDGSIIQMISHGLISAALFLCVGVVYDRFQSRMISSYGGLVNVMPKYAFVFMIFTLGALGLPGTSGFVGEFLVLVGIFQKNILVAILASFGVILAAAYMLWLYRKVIFGRITNSKLKNMTDLNNTEIGIFASLAFLILFLGVYPDPLFNTIDVSVNNLIEKYYSNLSFYLKINSN